MIAREDKGMEAAVVTLRELSAEDEIRLQCEARDMYEHDKASYIGMGYDKGRREEAVNTEWEQVRAEKERVRAEKEWVRAEKERVRAEKEQARAEKERNRAEKAQARAEEAEAEVVRLKELLKNNLPGSDGQMK